MHLLDEDKTVFTTGHAIYCYKVMPFGLNNARAHLLADGQWSLQGVDRTHNESVCRQHAHEESWMFGPCTTFGRSIRSPPKIQLKLNPEKCTFRVASGKFFEYLVTQQGIKADSNQISAILDMMSPTCIKEVQILNGCLAALNRFLSWSTDKYKPFFQAIKKNGADFCWDEQCEAAFQSLKAFLASPPLLS